MGTVAPMGTPSIVVYPNSHKNGESLWNFKLWTFIQCRGRSSCMCKVSQMKLLYYQFYFGCLGYFLVEKLEIIKYRMSII